MPTSSFATYQRALARSRADRERIIEEFHAVVNMSAAALAAWLDTDLSHAVGWRNGAREESIGHRSGRRIVELLRTRKSGLTDADLLHMRTVVGFVKRHLAQRPRDDGASTRWACSLKNWGHDPSRAARAGRSS